MDKLKELNRDKKMVTELKASMLQFTESTAGKQAISGIDTSWAQNCANLISLYFQALEDTYGEKKPKKKADNPE